MLGGRLKKFNRFLLAAVLFLPLLYSCASTGQLPGFSAGEQKNSLPLMGKDAIEEIHFIAVPPFYGDAYDWKGAAQKILASSKKISVISGEKINRITKENRKEFSLLDPGDRTEFLGKIGRSLRVDAVLNGIILRGNKKNEIILQLVLTKDARILWWQAVDFSFKEGSLSRADQQELLSKMLEPLLLNLGKREKPVVTPASKPKHKDGNFEGKQKTDTKKNIGKKPDKEGEESDISPM